MGTAPIGTPENPLREAERRVARRWGVSAKCLRPKLDLNVDEVDALQARSTWWGRLRCGWRGHPGAAYLPWLEAWVCVDCGRVEHATLAHEG